MMDGKYQFQTAEKQMQDFWQEHQVYAYSKTDPKAPLYSIDTPPPTVSGSLHIGHIFSYTQAEMIARFQRMQGKRVFYPFGFDDNGLPTERLVEKEKKIYAKDVPRSEFIVQCVETASKYEAEFKELWQSLGLSVDWDLQYQTVSPLSQKVSQRSFLDLVSKGKAYIKESPVLWCTECHTAIAQSELDTAEAPSRFNDIIFLVEDKPLLIATTRPELLNAVVCLFVHPEDERYTSYIGKEAMVPLFDYKVPIKADPKVNKEKGTGVVMCATFGDSTDSEWFMQYNLPYRKVILPNGRIDESVPFIGGMKVHAARQESLRLLEEKGLMVKSEEIVHSVSTHERCGKPIEIIPSRQWYIDVLNLKDRLMQAADQINWYPESMKFRYTSWVENLKWDWCISRQRYFGVPFPVWYCKECGTPVFASEDQLPVNPQETPYQGTCSCGCTEFIPESAVLDTWHTSSVTPLINARFGEADSIAEELLPMTMRAQAHEIIRTWAFYTIVKSLYHFDEMPWKDIMISGFVLAKKGEKISKSKGNAAMSPPALIKEYSADILRYWTANSRLGTDTFFSTDELTIARRFVTKLWNASKFAISHLGDFDITHQPELLPIDRWMIERTNQTIKTASELLNEYEIGSARHEIDDFFWKDLCDYYLEIVKERLYQPEVHGHAQRRSGQYALYYALINVLKLYAPYVPHITEYIYQAFFRQHENVLSLHQTTWPKPEQVDEAYLAFGESVKDEVAAVRKSKSEKQQSLKAEVELMTVHTTPAMAEWYRLTEMDLKACCIAKAFELIVEEPTEEE